jgi:hypothetical protein
MSRRVFMWKETASKIGFWMFLASLAAGQALADPLAFTPARLSAPDGAHEDRFGTQVAIDGNTAVVAAPHRTVGSNSGQGGVYIFVRRGTAWTFHQSLVAPDGAPNEGDEVFGRELSAPTNASVDFGHASGTIRDDDAPKARRRSLRRWRLSE